MLENGELPLTGKCSDYTVKGVDQIAPFYARSELTELQAAEHPKRFQTSYKNTNGADTFNFLPFVAEESSTALDSTAGLWRFLLQRVDEDNNTSNICLVLILRNACLKR